MSRQAAVTPLPRLFAGKQEEESFLLQEFKTHTGEVVNPYAVLKLPRTADLCRN